MQFRTLFTIMMGTLILFLLGCGVDELKDSDSTLPGTEPLGSITGRVLDENGTPVSGATVTTEPETSQIITAADGGYKIPDVRNGSYTVWAQTSDREGNAPVSLKGGVAIADIRLTDKIVSVTITEKPAEQTTNPNVTFSWTGRNVTAYSYKLDDGAWSAWGTVTTIEYKDLAPGEHTFGVKGRDDTGQESKIVTWPFTISTIPPISIEITDPRPNDQVPWKHTIKGKIKGDVKDLQDLKKKLNVQPGEELKVGLWVWDPKDPHGPWEQPFATIQNSLAWVEDDQAWFGGGPNQHIGIHFNVKAALVKKKGAEVILIEEVEPITITDVIRKQG